MKIYIYRSNSKCFEEQKVSLDGQNERKIRMIKQNKNSF